MLQSQRTPFWPRLLALLQLKLSHVPWHHDCTPSVTILFDTLDRSLSPSKIVSSTKCIGRIFLAMGKNPLMQRSIYVVGSKISTAKFSTTTNNVCICSVLISTVNEMILCTLIDSFVAVQSWGASKRLVRHSQCGLRKAWEIRFGPAPASAKHVVQYSA